MVGKQAFRPATPLLFLVMAVSALGQNVPDAPIPLRRHTHTYAASKWYGIVDPDEKVPPLYARDKMAFWVHEDSSAIGWIPGLISAGWGQLLVSDPNYGSDSAAFGERVGAAVLRDTSMRFFSDSLIPTLAHEDPRYFRKAYGGIKSAASMRQSGYLWTSATMAGAVSTFQSLWAISPPPRLLPRITLRQARTEEW
jgi:hypothetical protein